MRKIIFISILLISQIGSAFSSDVSSSSSSSQSQIESIQKLAESGNPEAQFQFALALQLGKVVPSNLELAAKFLEQAAKQNHGLAAGHLGAAYLHGRGVEVNYEKSFYWNQVAANLDSQSAQTTLSALYLDGLGTSKNYSAAYFWALVATSHPNPIKASSTAADYGANAAWSDSVNQAKKLANVAESKLDPPTIIKIQNDVQLYKNQKRSKSAAKTS